MQAIATLVNDDPYLRMPRCERIALRRRRREKFKPCFLASPIVRVERILPIAPAPVDLAPMHEKNVLAEWIERQKEIPVPVPVVARPPSRIRTVDIQRGVARHFDVPWNVMVSPSRLGRVVLPRQIAMYLTQGLVGISLPDIGRRFGGRDHTTVLHAVRKIQKMMDADAVFEAGIERLRAAIVEGRA